MHQGLQSLNPALGTTELQNGTAKRQRQTGRTATEIRNGGRGPWKPGMYRKEFTYLLRIWDITAAMGFYGELCENIV